MDVPFVDLSANYRRIQPEIDDAIRGILEDGWFVGGGEVSRFERDFADYLGVAHGIGVNSGTDAIRLALEAVGVGAGDEVITVAHTFVSSVDGIVNLGARPRLVDIEPETYTADPDEITAKVSDDTAAIVPVHLYGQPVDLDPILDVADRHDIPVVEDACQAHGSTYKGRSVGQFGDVSCFSFYPSKNLGAYGDGGFVATESDEIAEEVRLLSEYGKVGEYTYERVGHNSRLDTLQAGILTVKLDHLDEWNEDRRRVADSYTKYLQDIPLRTPIVRSDASHVYHLYVVQADTESERDALRDYLSNHGVGTGIHYPVPVHKQPSYQTMDYQFESLPKTERAASRILSLPMYPELTNDQILYVCDVIESFYEESSHVIEESG